MSVTKYNEGTPNEFECATPTDKQIRETFGLSNIRLDMEGDDMTIYVYRDRDRYPIGEMSCVSHESLSPIKPKNNPV